MAEKNDGGDKTEKPTPKRLRDARRKGDVAKSKDFSVALAMVVWFILFTAAAGYLGGRVMTFMEQSIAESTTTSFAAALPALGWSAAGLVLLIAGFTLVPAALAGLAAEFLQTGVVITSEKLKPSLSKMNPVDGLKKMFNLDNLVELVKTLIKAALILAITGFVLLAAADELGNLLLAAAHAPPTGSRPEMAAMVLDLSRSLTIQLIAWTTGVFLLVAFADRAWAHHRYIKQLRMSRRDIKQEHKDSEGDPMLRAQRRQMHEEWANQNSVAAAGKANVLLVNPTHLAVALDYDPEACPIPVIAAKGEGPLAAAMRAEAERESVPIVRNIGLARTIFATGTVNDIVPEALFDAIAEIILWAQRARAGEVPAQREDS